MPKRSTRILLNDNIGSRAQQRGVARYFREIVTGIITELGRNVAILSPHSGDYGVAKHIHSIRFRGSRRLRVDDVLASVVAYRERAAVVYSPYYGNMWTTAAEIFTVYDLITELFPQYYSAEHRLIAEKKHCFERAAKLMAISESTANDLLTHYPHIDAGKIVVTHPGVDEFFFATDNQQEKSAEKPFFLYVGNRSHHKNFLRLLIAFGQSGLAKEFDLVVISPTGSGFNLQETECIRKHRLQKSVRLISAASDETLRDCYAEAVAFVYPSEYEGFGLPMLEAMASGTLVATSNVSSMPEVGGDVAFYFDPYSVESIVDCLRKVVELPTEQRRYYIAQGIARAKTFTWARCRQQTINVFRQFV